jgi:hypothetical protein
VLTLGEELLLVALDADKGVLRGSAAMQIGPNAAGMAELLAAGWIRLRQEDGTPGVVVVSGGEPRVAEDELMSEVLYQARNMRAGDRHPERGLKNWPSPSLFPYFDSLRKRGVLTWDKPKNSAAIYGRFRLLDTEAAAAAKARIERVATGSGPSGRDADLAAIVHGLGLDKILYKGRRGRSMRDGLAKAVAKQRLAVMLAQVLPEVPEQKFTFDSSNDRKLTMDLSTAWNRDIP